MANQQHVRFYYHQNQFVARWHVPFHLAGKDGQPRLLSIRVVRLSTAKTTRTLSIAGTNKNSEARSILLDRTEADGLGELTDSNASIDPGQFPSRRSIKSINFATRNCQEFRQISQNAAEKKNRERPEWLFSFWTRLVSLPVWLKVESRSTRDKRR